ncbi:MAG: anti-sigma factor antagonist [Lachnospiraceae bacterium]|nr:anti-sigma factor antagonist [Lachnospiraceae bacterium]
MSTMELKGNRLVVHLPAELDHHCTEDLRRNIDRWIQEEPIQELEFDFSRTVFMDSAGIGIMIGRHKMMTALDGKVIATHMNVQIQKVLKLSGIEKYISFYKEETV